MTTLESLTEDIQDLLGEKPEVTLETTLDELGIDSLDRVELMEMTEDRHEVWVKELDWAAAKTVGDLVDTIENAIAP